MKRILVLGLVVVLVAAGWTGAWLWGAGELTAQVKALAAADGVTTPKLVCGSFGVGGYPFGFDATCAAATVSIGDTTVTATGLKASAEVYNPTHVLVFAQSPVTLADAFTGSRSRIDFAGFEGSVRLNGWRLERASLVVERPAWTDTVLEDRPIASAAHAEAHLIDLPAERDAVAGLAGLGEYIKLDGVAAPGFAIAAGSATLEGAVSRLPADVRRYAEPELLQRWQAAGGTFSLKSLKGDDGATHLAANGSFGLDAAGRVNGTLKLTSSGVVERLGPLLPGQFRGLVVGAPAADGSYSQNLSIAAGVVFAGIVPAGVLPALF